MLDERKPIFSLLIQKRLVEHYIVTGNFSFQLEKYKLSYEPTIIAMRPIQFATPKKEKNISMVNI